MTTFDELFAEHNLTPNERKALVMHLATLRAQKTVEALQDCPLASAPSTPPPAVGEAVPSAQGEPVSKWEGAEEWMPLAWELCADECGEEACTELVWEGGPIPEPWGDRWLKYEDEAKRLIALVHKHVPLASAPSTPPHAVMSQAADLLAESMMLADADRVRAGALVVEAHNLLAGTHAVVEAVPLTDEQMLQCVRSVGGPRLMGLTRDYGPYEVTEPTHYLRELVRAIERAHGIAPKAAQH
jgi:hypothetical protein